MLRYTSTLLQYIQKSILLMKTRSTESKAQKRLTTKPVFPFNRTVPKRPGEHAQIEKKFINPRSSGCIRVSK